MFTKDTLNFWENARDSMLHALEHAAELTETKTLKLPDKLDPSVAAFSVLAILRTCSRRFGFSVEEIFEQYPPIQNQLVELICWRKIKEYEDFITEALKEEFPDRRYFHECPYCGLSAIVDGKCMCCFTEVITEECPYCEEEILIPSYNYGIAEIKCPSCGKAVL